MPGFGATAKGRLPPSIEAPPNFGSSAKLLEQAYIASAARTRPRSAALPMTPGSALRSSGSEWGAQRQSIPLKSVQAEVQERLRGAGGPPPKPTRMVSFDRQETLASQAVEEAAASTFSSGDGDLGGADDADALLDSVYEREAGATGDEDDGYGEESASPTTPSRAPGVEGQLARARALLADATAEQARLQEELAYERARADNATADVQAELQKERSRYRREVDFVRAGVDAAAAQRDAAAAKRKEANERALKRAVREAEERASAEASASFAAAQEATDAATAEMAARYEKQMEALTLMLTGLASEVRRLQTAGAWPGGPDAGGGGGEDEEEEEPLDAAGAHQLLAAAIAEAERAAAG